MLAGCGAESDGGPRVVFRDSAGIVVVENPSPDDSVRNDWWAVDGLLVDIGGYDAQEPYALFRVSDALLLADGRIAVGSSASDDVRYFDGTGQHLKTSGRTGSGPGEYQNVSGLERGIADSLLVIDASARRISVLDPDGDYVRAFDAGRSTLITRVVGRFGDGSLLTAPAARMGPEPGTSGQELIRPPFTLIRIATMDGVPDTLGSFPGAERMISVQSSLGELTAVSIIAAPFAKSPTFAVHGDQVYIGSQDGPEIPVIGQDGVLRRIIRTGRAMEPLTEAHLEAHHERRIESLPEDRRVAGPYDGPTGDVVPPYAQLRTDHVGNLWVADFDDPTDPPGRWTVYGPDGGVLARIVLPDRFQPFDIGDDWVLGRELDDFDVEHVRLYSLAKRTE